MGEGNFLDIILLAMVAGFIFLRLRSVLGRRTGHERQPTDPVGVGQGNDDEKVVRLPNRGPAGDENIRTAEQARLWADDSPIGAGLTQIKIADHSFEPDQFIEGARAAYEMIVAAFPAGDRDTLKMLLSPEVYQNFSAAIDEREEAGHTMESTIVALKKADIVEAELKDKTAEITVKFVSEMISVTRDSQGENLPGQSPVPREVTDIWTFARDAKSGDPNWLLVETRSEN
tara:strand:- start:559 stop:1248 length:690 start_codon:yes stop_codon:yes gene_type:complete